MAVSVGLSVRTERFDLADLAPALDEAERLGVDSVELPLFSLYLVADARPLGTRVEHVRRTLAGRPFALTLHGSLGINLMDLPERLAIHEAVASAEIAVAGRLGARVLVLHAGFERADHPSATADALRRQQDALRRLGDRAREHGLTLCVENVFSDGERKALLPSRVAAEIAAVAHDHVRGTLDLSHAAVECTARGADLWSEVSVLAPLCRHLHVHDSFGRPRPFRLYSESEALAFGAGDLHLPLGLGGLPWATMVRDLVFDSGVTANLELGLLFWSEVEACLERVRGLAGAIRTAPWGQS